MELDKGTQSCLCRTAWGGNQEDKGIKASVECVGKAHLEKRISKNIQRKRKKEIAVGKASQGMAVYKMRSFKEQFAPGLSFIH